MEDDKAEDEKVDLPKKKSLRKRIKSNWHVVIKIIEMSLCIVCIGLIYEPLQNQDIIKGHLHHLGVIYTSFSGYLLIMCVMFTSFLFNEAIGYKTSTMFSICAACLNIITAILIFTDKDHFKSRIFHPNMYLLPLLIGCSVCAFVNGIVYFVDAVFTFKYKRDFGPN
ncbi:uncharacterized protein [Onthophagus taurus]|uniref:uncharacterized protein n=1 Tax=Onthophagus taurus TaxID=166361 RepID=UPI0039BE1DAB